MKNTSISELESLFSSIKIGHVNAIKPPRKLSASFEKYVDERNCLGDVVIKSNRGYYRPFPLDDTDSSDFSKYIESEYNRGMKIIEKCNTMTKLYSSIEDKILQQWEEK